MPVVMNFSQFARLLFAWMLIVAGVFSTGCQVIPEATADPTRYYVLTGPAPVAANPAGKYIIGLRPVELPGYLRNHRDIVVRDGLNEIRFQDYARWAEPLEVGLHRSLKERLLATETVGVVTGYPFSADVRRDYDVIVRILRCEGAMTGEKKPVARFEAMYEIVAAGVNGQLVVRRTFAAPDLAWDGRDFSALARLLSEGVEKLSVDIAENLPKAE
jgi:uncharacterized lipoprotein YmbA